MRWLVAMCNNLTVWVAVSAVVLALQLTPVYAAAPVDISPTQEELLPDPNDYQWGILFYYGRMTDATLNQVLRFQGLSDLNPARLYSAEVSYQLHEDNLIRRFFQPIVSTVDVALNFTYANDPNGTIYQINPYIMWVWNNFPWNHIITTSFGIGEGLSYSSRPHQRELRDSDKAESARNFLNYLMFEAAFSLPQHPEWQLIYRVHHRSGVFGLYTPGIVGSTAIGAAIRYRI